MSMQKYKIIDQAPNAIGRKQSRKIRIQSIQSETELNPIGAGLIRSAPLQNFL
jgi:hypothetical protein